MKKFLLMAAAAAVVTSSPAMAQWAGKTYGQDAIGWYSLDANVQTFCKFGTANTGGTGTNSIVTPGAPGTAAEADGTFALNIQKLSDNTIQAASGTFKIGHAVCNAPFAMEVNSANGGLKNTATTTDTAFTSVVPYKVHFTFDGLGNVVNSAVGTQNVGNSTEARAGNGGVKVDVAAQDKLLIQGTYSDFLIAQLVPNPGL